MIEQEVEGEDGMFVVRSMAVLGVLVDCNL